MQPNAADETALCARPTRKFLPWRLRRSRDGCGLSAAGVFCPPLLVGRTKRGCVRGSRPARQLFRMVIEPIRHAPIRRELVLAVFGCVAEGCEPFLLELRNRLHVNLE